MSYLNRILTSRYVKVLLIICAIAMIIAAIWFLGPFFGFGETRPLQRIESRVILIVLALLGVVSFILRWPVFIITAATICVLTWIIGPFLLIGESYPLAPVNVRLIIIAAVVLVAFLYGLWCLLIALKDNPALLDKFVWKKEEKPENTLSEVASVVRNAVEYMYKNRKHMPFFKRMMLAGKRHELLPWYIVIGTNGAGKTAAILNSGQHFPQPEQLNFVGKETHPPTRNCECWFANDAIYVDTSGKYVSTDGKNLNEWHGLLKILKKYRPVKAINGAIVTFSAADILGKSKEELFELVASLRARLDELRHTLGVRFPAYVLVTKLDQLPGFNEYFRILTEQEREQVWGATFPYGDAMTSGVSAFYDQIKEELDLLKRRIERDMIVRQQEEYDTRDRCRMYTLPQDFQLLTDAVAEVVQNIFFASRYDETQAYSTLRGIYFTSSQQPADTLLLNNQSIVHKWSNYTENKTPAVLATITSQKTEGDFLINDVSYGRQYFLKQLFQDIIVKDADLARHSLANESKYRLQRFVGHACCLGAAVFLLNGFHDSFKNNARYLAAVADKTAVLNGETQRFVRTSDENLLPGVLSATQYLPEYDVLDVYHPALAWRYGLYTGDEVVRESENTYQYFLRRMLLPKIEQQVTLALQKTIESGKANDIYENLKLYLMVFGQGKFNQRYVANSISKLWESEDKLQPYEEKRIFIAHLNYLFGHDSWRQFGQQADEGLIKYARAMLEREDVASRLYDRFKLAVAADVPADLTLGNIAKGEGAALFTMAEEGSEHTVPGLFTKEGYQQLVKKRLSISLPVLEQEDDWVMGKQDKPKLASLAHLRITKGTVINPLQVQILSRYLDEYRRHWQNFLAGIRIETDSLSRDYGDAGITSDVFMLRTLASADSPLINIVNRAVDETTLSAKEEQVLPDNLVKGQILNAATKISLAYAALEKKMVWQQVDSHFAPLREFVTGSRMPASSDAPSSATSASGTQLEKLISALSEQYTLFVMYDDALKAGNSPPLSPAAKKLGAEAKTWPDPLKNMIVPLFNGAWSRAAHKSIARSNERIDDSLGSICRATLAGRFPFSAGRREVKLADFERFFAEGGLADDYFRQNLADKVDTSTHPWRYKDNEQGLSTGELRMFEQAAEIRHAFFQQGGQKISLPFTVSVPYLDSAIMQLSMNFDGKQVNYAHGPVVPVSLNWPGLQGGARISINASPHLRAIPSGMLFTGPWALFRWLENARRVVSSDTGETVLVYSLDNRHRAGAKEDAENDELLHFGQDKRRADIQVTGLTFNNKPVFDLLTRFRCPGN